jgi:DNA-binding transcriptional LysR family regulator
MINLDLAALRTFVLIADLGGFGRTARKLHRTPGAISLQMKALEERLGIALFVRRERTPSLTSSGAVLLAYARKLLVTNDEAVLALQGFATRGEVRFGMPQDLADSWLPHTLAKFSRAFPSVHIEIRVGRSNELNQALQDGELDLALVFGSLDSLSSDLVSRLGVRWVASPELRLKSEEPVPLLLLGAPCAFRESAKDTLDGIQRPWRIVLESSSVSAIWAAAEAGLGVTARTVIYVPDSLTTVGKLQGLPPLKDIGLFLRRANRSTTPVVEHLQHLVRETVEIKCAELENKSR